MGNFTINFKHLTDTFLGSSLTYMAVPLTLNKTGFFQGPRPPSSYFKKN